jgi:hypothetical protein
MQLMQRSLPMLRMLLNRIRLLLLLFESVILAAFAAERQLACHDHDGADAGADAEQRRNCTDRDNGRVKTGTVANNGKQELMQCGGRLGGTEHNVCGVVLYESKMVYNNTRTRCILHIYILH